MDSTFYLDLSRNLCDAVLVDDESSLSHGLHPGRSSLIKIIIYKEFSPISEPRKPITENLMAHTSLEGWSKHPCTARILWAVIRHPSIRLRLAKLDKFPEN